MGANSRPKAMDETKKRRGTEQEEWKVALLFGLPSFYCWSYHMKKNKKSKKSLTAQNILKTNPEVRRKLRQGRSGTRNSERRSWSRSWSRRWTRRWSRRRIATTLVTIKLKTNRLLQEARARQLEDTNLTWGSVCFRTRCTTHWSLSPHSATELDGWSSCPRKINSWAKVEMPAESQKAREMTHNRDKDQTRARKEQRQKHISMIQQKRKQMKMRGNKELKLKAHLRSLRSSCAQFRLNLWLHRESRSFCQRQS